MSNSKHKDIRGFYAVLWKDAAYSFVKRMPRDLPLPQLTTGFVCKNTKDYIVITTNMERGQSGRVKPLDGFLIPKPFIVSAEKIRVKSIWRKKIDR